MLPINTSTTRLFSADQVFDHTIDFWDSPFTPIVSDVASDGILFSLVQPTSTGAFTVKSALQAATAANAASAWTGATATTVVSSGRLPNLVGYWAAGAPGYHGANYRGRVAYRFQCTLRSTTGRGWWSSSSSVTFWLAFAGCGYVRVVKTVSGTPSNVLVKTDHNGTGSQDVTLTEALFIKDGFAQSEAITLAAGDKLDIYYVQDTTDAWGGFVFKAITGSVPSLQADMEEAARTGPVLGCSIFDSGTSVTKQTLELAEQVTVEAGPNGTMRAVLRVPLINPQQYDGHGWEFYRPTTTHPGYMRLHKTDGTVVDVKRQRLIRIKAGLSGEQVTVFTGLVDDFDGSDTGRVDISCLGLEQYLADQFMRNLPDKISYMMFGYNELSGTTEPVYDVPAYDNWPQEYAIRDMLMRAGVDECRTRVQLTVPKSDGTSTPVYV